MTMLFVSAPNAESLIGRDFPVKASIRQDLPLTAGITLPIGPITGLAQV
jgi:hypothetical protein